MALLLGECVHSHTVSSSLEHMVGGRHYLSLASHIGEGVEVGLTEIPGLICAPARLRRSLLALCDVDLERATLQSEEQALAPNPRQCTDWQELLADTFVMDRTVAHQWNDISASFPPGLLPKIVDDYYRSYSRSLAVWTRTYLSVERLEDSADLPCFELRLHQAAAGVSHIQLCGGLVSVSDEHWELHIKMPAVLSRCELVSGDGSECAENQGSTDRHIFRANPNLWPRTLLEDT